MDEQNGVRVVEERYQLPNDALLLLGRRLDGYPKAANLGSDWDRGVPGDWLDALLEDWRVFDPAALQLRLDALRQQRAEVAGHALHLVHAEGRGPSPLRLLLTHGWPGSFLEYLPVLPLLSDPGAHGADPGDAFTVIVPSLPGYAFSGPPPPTGMTGRQVARLWHQLMTVGLGYDRFVAHGSDLGAGVTAWLARDHPEAVAAIHLATPGLAIAPGPRTEREEDFACAVRDWTAEEGGYMHEHATKPATLGAGLSDSPVALAAWIGEKVVAWSSTRPDGSPAFDRELLLATLTLYWTTETITTSLLPYWAHRHVAGAALPAGDVSPVPTAISIFGASKSRSPSHLASSLSATSTSPRGLNTPPGATFPPSPSRNCWRKACATRFVRCDRAFRTRRYSGLYPRMLGSVACSDRAGLTRALRLDRPHALHLPPPRARCSTRSPPGMRGSQCAVVTPRHANTTKSRLRPTPLRGMSERRLLAMSGHRSRRTVLARCWFRRPLSRECMVTRIVMTRQHAREQRNARSASY